MPPVEFNLNTPKAATKSISKWLWLVFVLVVMVGAAFWAVTILKTGEVSPDLTKGKPIINNTLPEGYKYVATGAGEYPTGFPKELVLFKDAKIIRGENTTDGTGVNHKIVDYTINQSLAEVTSQYQSKLPPLKWNLSGKPITQGTLQILNFAKDKTTLTVIISTKTATSSQVSLDLKI